MFSTVVAPVYNPTNRARGPFFRGFITCSLIFLGVRAIALRPGFAFPDVMLSTCSHTCGQSACLPWENAYSNPLPIFLKNRIVFPLLGCTSASYFFIWTTFQINDLEMISPTPHVAFSFCSWFRWLHRSLLVGCNRIVFAFLAFALGIKTSLLRRRSVILPPTFFSRFMVLRLMFRS